MTNEEKAKAYDEALEVMRQWIAPCHTKEQLDTLKKSVFPELTESEDERIRTELLSSFKGIMADADEDELWYGLPYNDIIAWLEKQKEPTTEELYAEAGTTEKEYIANTMKMVRAMREKKKEQKPADLPVGFYVTFPDGKKYYTKEMRCNGMNVKVVEPKLAEWNEEDETQLTNTLIMLKEYAIHHYSKDDVEKSVDWLENRVKFLRPQSKPEWSEKDEKQIRQIERIVKDAGGSVKLQEQIHNWFESLRPSWKPSEEQMEALKCAVEDVAKFSKRGGRQIELENEPYYSALHSLYCSLEKLM